MPTYLRCPNGHVFQAPEPATDSPFEGLTPEQIAELDAPLDYHDPVESEFSKRLRELGFDNRAKRSEDCGKYFRYFKHGPQGNKPGHVWRSPASRCMLRSCPFDAKVESTEHIRRYAEVEKLIASHFTHMELTFPINHDDPACTQATAKRLQIIVHHALMPGTLTKLGYRAGQMILKVINLAAVTNELRIQITNLALEYDARVTTAVLHRSEFPKVLESVMGMELPQDDRTRAEFEAVLAWMKQVTSYKIPKVFVYEKVYTKTLEFSHPTQPTRTLKIGLRPCPHCGIDPEYVSDWQITGASIADLQKKRWREAVKKPPN